MARPARPRSPGAGTFEPVALQLSASVQAHEIARAIGEVVVRVCYRPERPANFLPEDASAVLCPT